MELNSLSSIKSLLVLLNLWLMRFDICKGLVVCFYFIKLKRVTYSHEIKTSESTIVIFNMKIYGCSCSKIGAHV